MYVPSVDELLDKVAKILKDNPGAVLSTRLLVDNGFPKNAIVRRLGGIQEIAKALNIENPYKFKTIKGTTLNHNSVFDYVNKLSKFEGKEVTLEEVLKTLNVSSRVKKSKCFTDAISILNIRLIKPHVKRQSETGGNVSLFSIRKAAEFNGGIRPNKAVYDKIRKDHPELNLEHSRYIVKQYANNGGWLQACRDAGFEVEQDRSMQSRWLNYFEKVSGIKLLREAHFDTCRNPSTGRLLFFDGYSKEFNLLVEFQDRSHFENISYYEGDSGLLERQEKDRFKAEWASENGFKLLQYAWFDGFNKNKIINKLKELQLCVNDYSLQKVRLSGIQTL